MSCRACIIASMSVLWSIPSTGAQAEPRPLVFGVNRVADPRVLFDPPGYDEHVYRRIREVGGTCVRILASPREIEHERGTRDWTDFDRDLSLALKYEQEPIVLIANTPAWASVNGKDTHEYPYKTELLPEFADFCADLARRTKGKARLFQFWNEPNGCGWHCFDGFNHADEYFPVLQACHEGIKRGNPDALLSLGGLDDAEGHGPIFVRKTYEEKARAGITRPLFDAISDHPYSPTPEIMRGKLDAIREVLAANGEGDLPFWITEYGWNTREFKPADQAQHVAEFLAAFATPQWDDLQAAVYLCIADFEHRNEGFGLTDANLRPKPAFHAFQAASRFGAMPPFRIEPVFTAADALRITFKTLEPARAKVALTPAEQGRESLTRETSAGKEHSVTFDGLRPDAVYRFVIETTREDAAQEKSIRSAEYEVRSPARTIHNGDFSRGFFAGIAEGWRIDGDGFCTDAALVPTVKIEPGTHAQAIFARANTGLERLDSTLSTTVAAEKGSPLRIRLSWAGDDTRTLADITARVGIDPTGGTDPGSPRIAWTDWTMLKRSFQDQEAMTTSENTAVRLFVQCRSKGPLKDGTAVFMLKDVKVVPSE